MKRSCNAKIVATRGPASAHRVTSEALVHAGGDIPQLRRAFPSLHQAVRNCIVVAAHDQIALHGGGFARDRRGLVPPAQRGLGEQQRNSGCNVVRRSLHWLQSRRRNG